MRTKRERPMADPNRVDRNKNLVYRYPNLAAVAAKCNAITEVRQSSDEKRSYSWDGGVKSLDAAIDCATRSGWGSDKLKGISDVRAHIGDKVQSLMPTQETTYDVWGDEPCIARYLSEVPDCMARNEDSTYQASPFRGVFKIGVNPVVRYDQQADDMIWYGLASLIAADTIEQLGYQSQIDCVFMTSNQSHSPDGTLAVEIITIKEVNQQADIRRSMFALACPAMPRRIGFRLHEDQEHIDYGVSAYTYGYPVYQTENSLTKEYDLFMGSLDASRLNWLHDTKKTAEWIVSKLREAGLVVEPYS